MGSAAEAEVAALHVNAHDLMPVRDCLSTSGFKQTTTRIKTDNVTAKGFVQNTIEQKRSRSHNGKFWWLKDRMNEFVIEWAPGATNLADYFTKHHTGSHHSEVRPIHQHEGDSSPLSLQGCVELLMRAHAKPASNATSQADNCKVFRVATDHSSLCFA